MSNDLHGVVGGFPSPELFLHALRELREGGYQHVEANVPFAVDGMEDLLPGKPTPVARVVLITALIGGSGGYGLQYWATHDYPLNVGGRPLHSWPAFIPVTFELTVLTASLCGVIALLWLARMPRLDYPLFGVTGFSRASQDRFFVGVRSDDPRFDRRELAAFLYTLGAESIQEVPS